MFSRRHLHVAAIAAVLLITLAVAEARDSVKDAKKFRDALPRYHNQKEFKPTERDYQIAIAVFAAIPIAFAVLTLLAAFLFCLCRCCSCIGLCHCCVRPPREEGYSKRARYVPWLFLAAFGALAFSFASVGLAENTKVSKTMTSKTDLSVAWFIPHAFDTVQAKIDSIQAPIQNVSDNLQPTVDQAVDIINDNIDTVDSGLTNLTDEMTTYGNTWGSYVITTDIGNFTCDFCAEIGQTMTDLATQIDDQAQGTIDDMRNTINDVKSTLTDKVSEIEDKLGDVNSTINDARDNVLDARKTGDDVVDNIDKYDPKRKLATMIIYIVPIAGLGIVIVGTVFKLGALFKINVWVYFLVTFIMWLLLGVYLPVAMVLSDACVYANDYQAKLYSKDDKLSKVAVSCLENESIIDALNATDQFNFTDAIQFPELPDIASNFNFSILNELQSNISALTIETFGWDDSNIEDIVTTFNTAYSTSYTSADIESKDPATEFPLDNQAQADLVTAQQGVHDAKAAKADIQDALTALQNDTDHLVATNQALTTTFSDVKDNIANLEDLTDPFLDAANDLKDQANCKFAADLYHEFHDLTCTKILNHFSVLAMTCFFIGLSGWFIIVFSQISASRVPRPFNPDFTPSKKSGEIELRQIQVRSKEIAH